jgi:hypothetical protein
VHKAILTLSEEANGWWTSREAATTASLFWCFKGGVVGFFLEGTSDSLTTIVSSWECPSGVVEVSKRETAATSFFSLLSSLRRNHSTSRRRKTVNDRKTWKAKWSKLMSPVTRTFQSQSPWQQQAPLMHLLEWRYSRKPSLLLTSSFSLDLYLRSQQGEAM